MPIAINIEMLTFAQFLSEDHTILWYDHPEKGIVYHKHPGSNTKITHAELMAKDGLTGHKFDKANRGRFSFSGQKGKKGAYGSSNPSVDEFLHTGKDTPDSVYNHVKKHHPAMGKLLFTANHKIKRQE